MGMNLPKTPYHRTTKKDILKVVKVHGEKIMQDTRKGKRASDQIRWITNHIVKYEEQKDPSLRICGRNGVHLIKGWQWVFTILKRCSEVSSILYILTMSDVIGLFNASVWSMR